MLGRATTEEAASTKQPRNTTRSEPTAVASRYLRGVGITALCTLVAYPLYPRFDAVNIVMVYLLGATLAGLRLGRGPSALTAIANTAAFDFFFVPPRYTFYVADTQYIFTMGVMLGVALVIANLMASVRRQTEVAAERERRTAMLYELNRELAVAADADAIATVASRHVGDALEGRACVVLTDPASGLAPSIAAGEFSVSLSGKHRELGVLVFAPHDPVELVSDQRALLQILASQIASALERARLAEEAAASRAAAERAALRNTLLASISHDLRGPLSAIAGAGSLVAQSTDHLDRHRRVTLGNLIEEKARDMSGLLTNVLELMRLETTDGLSRAEWQSLEELVGTAIRYNEHRLGAWRIHTDIPEDFPLVFLDGQLIVQLLANLLENASKYTPQGTLITVAAARGDMSVTLSVEDTGPGFGTKDPESLFEKFERGAEEGHVSGVGLGLAICRAIARLHRGEIHAINTKGGGARFEITLPFEPMELA